MTIIGGVEQGIKVRPIVTDGQTESQLEKPVPASTELDNHREMMEVLGNILIELRVLSTILNDGMNLKDDLNTLREDEEFDLGG